MAHIWAAQEFNQDEVEVIEGLDFTIWYIVPHANIKIKGGSKHVHIIHVLKISVCEIQHLSNYHNGNNNPVFASGWD